MATRVLKKPRGTNNLYSNDEKLQLDELVAKRKEEHDFPTPRLPIISTSPILKFSLPYKPPPPTIPTSVPQLIRT